MTTMLLIAKQIIVRDDIYNCMPRNFLLELREKLEATKNALDDLVLVEQEITTEVDDLLEACKTVLKQRREKLFHIRYIAREIVHAAKDEEDTLNKIKKETENPTPRIHPSWLFTDRKSVIKYDDVCISCKISKRTFGSNKCNDCLKKHEGWGPGRCRKCGLSVAFEFAANRSLLNAELCKYCDESPNVERQLDLPVATITSSARLACPCCWSWASFAR